ncbi:hypothetical protein [Pseudokineococcus sp. 1T1Z-3]|uniref:hypothetical protein n=1 Tax=Pseudokineococcus sp. 1T1Z-3 TaxID=3132745 RepID=UPI0030AAFE5A
MDLVTDIHGSVRGVRTFRLTQADRLAPVTARPPWTSGVNTAVCDRRERRRRAIPEHQAPGRGCSCGLWACGNLEALRGSGVLGASRVLAVVAAHGTLIPATRGFRAQHAVIEALWLSPRIPATRRAAVARAYPAAAVYSNRRAMLSEHPLTVLPTYVLPTAPGRGVLFASLFALATWTVAVVVLWLSTPVPDGAATATPLVASAAAQLVAVSVVTVGHFTIATAALLLAVHGRWWRAAAATLVPQTVLLVAGHLALDDVTAWVQLAMAALSAAVLHTAAGAAFAWRWHTAESDHLA